MEDSPLQFARPLWLYAGPVVCVITAWLFTRFDRRRETDLAKLVHPRFRTRLMPAESRRLHLIKRILWLFCLLLLFIAAAGPQKGFEFREVKRRGIDILFAVDTSRSMLAEDLSPNRLERARLGIHDFISRLEGDRVGLIPFAGSAYALCPLTSDYEAFRETLNALETDLIPKQGTDVASAINEAQRLFDEQNNNHRILVLITDGEDLQGDALDAAREAAKKGMTVYPIGVGSPAGTTIPVQDQYGRRDFIRDQSGAPVTTKLDEATLRKIAEVSNGIYVPLGRGAEGLDIIYREKLRLVPKNEIEGRMEKIPLERFEWALALAILCLVMEFLLPDHRRSPKATALPSAGRRMRTPSGAAAVPVAAFLIGILAQHGSAQTTDPRLLYNQGTAAYTAGDFRASAESLRNALQTPDPMLQNRAYYNLGNALYRIGQETRDKAAEETIKSWEESVKAYADAMALDANDSDARFNHELVKRKLEELKKQNPDQKKDGDKKDGDKKDGEKQEGDKKDGEQKDGEQKDGEQKDGEQKDGEQKDGEQKDGEQKDGEQKKEGQTGEDGKKEEKEGKEGSAEGKDKEGKEKGQKETEGEGKEEKDAAKKQEKEKSSTEERRQMKPIQMTAKEAEQLMKMMRQEERTVIPIEPPPRRRFLDPNNTTKGKTW